MLDGTHVRLAIIAKQKPNCWQLCLRIHTYNKQEF